MIRWGRSCSLERRPKRSVHISSKNVFPITSNGENIRTWYLDNNLLILLFRAQVKSCNKRQASSYHIHTDYAQFYNPGRNCFLYLELCLLPTLHVVSTLEPQMNFLPDLRCDLPRRLLLEISQYFIVNHVPVTMLPPSEA